MRRTLLATSAVVLSVLGLATAVPAQATASTFLAGYRTTQIGISRATATVVMPTVTCDPTATQGVVFGIGNQSSPGVVSLLIGARVLCVNGEAQYGGYAIGTATHQIDLGGASAGDKFSLSVAQTPTKLTATAKDKSSGSTFTVSGAPAPDNTLTFGAFPIVSGVTPYPVPDFGTVTITAPVLENMPLSAWTPEKLTRRNVATEIDTSGFTANGNFRLKWVS